MDHQKKQTSDHEKLIREWIESKGNTCEFVLPVTRKDFKGSKLYVSASEDSLRLLEVVSDRDVNVIETIECTEEQTWIVKKGFGKLAVSSKDAETFIVGKQRDRLLHWLRRQPKIRIIEEKKLFL
ncbi:hypothetical protein [Salisediminibacterium beveridgei]|uniref:Uncharacterized protein n=1 Tax=Salisediminibacterium beveridgei TaxID=632773 RepID=A0A1D7QV91_9BACI|nr:hypothetical protein [Salisediminibacterium beveridgei]AOM82934.1 hypothetical protein BBEV_1573 [Salisediminibacterium beveridgei]